MFFLFKKIPSAFRLPRDKWIALFAAWRLLIQVRSQLKREHFGQLEGWMNKQLEKDWKSVLGPTTPRRVVWAVDRASWLTPGKSTCLHRALVTRILLAHQDIETILHIGARHDGEGKLEAHAWLEYKGQVIMGNLPDLDTYKRFEGLSI